MGERLGHAPAQSGLMHLGTEIGERTRGDGVPVVGRRCRVGVVTGDRSDAEFAQQSRDRAVSNAQQREGRSPLTIDVGGEQFGERVNERLGHGDASRPGRFVVTRSGQRSHHPLSPGWERGEDRVPEGKALRRKHIISRRFTRRHRRRPWHTDHTTGVNQSSDSCDHGGSVWTDNHWHARLRMERPRRIEPGPGQESVWDYPRPPRVEPTTDHVEVVFAGVVLVSTTKALRVLETSHPPAYYLPFADIAMEHVRPSGTRPSFCEWKGLATYFTIHVDGEVERDCAWTYASPTKGYEPLVDHLALYPGRMDECRVNGELVTPQDGGFYGGWITSRVVGPFKGGGNTWGW